MEWHDEGVLVGVRRHGETAAIVELFTLEHGRHLGVVLGGRSRRLRPMLQPGNSVLATWRARLDTHLGHYALEAQRLRAAGIMESAIALHALNHLCALARLLPERDPHPELYADLSAMLDRLGDRQVLPPMLVRFELAILSDLGFGLDLTSCAATGSAEDLAYVSPKSGRAVSRAAGVAYHDRLLALPPFLATEDRGIARPEPADIAAGFALTEYFLTRHVLAPRGLSMAEGRQAYLAATVPLPSPHTARSAVRLSP